MKFFDKPATASKSLRAMARLLGYPDTELRGYLPGIRDVLHSEAALTPQRLAELDALIESLQRTAPLEAEAQYVQLFDRGRSTSLHLFEHVHGDSRDRGPAMVDLAQSYEKAGLFLGEGELPDFLPVMLEFTSTQPAREARALLGEIAHILNVIFMALQERNSSYAAILGALLELAGETPQPVQVAPEESMDTLWEEPVVFDGCSTKGQAKPGQPQAINIVRKDRPAAGVRP